MASRILRTFGLAQKQIGDLQEAWRDIPDAWLLRANYDKGMGKMFLVQKLLTMPQYERLEQVALKKKQSVHDMVGELHRENILSFIKPSGEIESFDAIFAKNLQSNIQPKLQARFNNQIEDMLKSK